MLRVYDLDGTLISTRTANLQAYRAIGVEPPRDFHQMDWKLWCSEDGHDKKNEMLPRFLHTLEFLPLWEDYCYHYATADVEEPIILSNISAGAFKFVQDIIQGDYPWFGTSVHIQMDRPKKIEFIKSRTSKGIYYDDSLATCQAVANIPGWQAVHVLQEGMR